MYELSDAGHAAWRQLEQEWQAVQERWYDRAPSILPAIYGNHWRRMCKPICRLWTALKQY